MYGLSPVIDAEFDDGICLRERVTKDASYYFVMNETDETKIITLDKNYYDILNNNTIGGRLYMEPCEFYILKNV